MTSTPSYYSGAAPETTLATVFNHGRHAFHPWRYFIAAGESLAKIDEVKAEAENYQMLLQDYAATFGGKYLSYAKFHFENPAIIVEPESVKYTLPAYPGFVSDPAAPAQFYPVRNQELLKQMRAAAALPAEEKAAALHKLARSVGAINCDGQFFEFSWNERKELIAIPRQYRLASHPAFVTDDPSLAWFTPDLSRQDGCDIAEEVRRLNYKQYPEHCYSEWLGCNNVNTNPDGHPRFSIDRGRPNETQSAQLENIGGQWIIKVPVIGQGRYGANGEGGALSGYQEKWAVPPGAQPITISAYFSLLEGAGALSLTPGSRDAFPPAPPQP